jgi:hypothetical protein
MNRKKNVVAAIIGAAFVVGTLLSGCVISSDPGSLKGNIDFDDYYDNTRPAEAE